MADRDMGHLDPRFLPLAQKVLDEGNALGAAADPAWCVHVGVTWRGEEDQNLANQVGLSKANFGHSPHNCTDADGNPASLAMDFNVIEGTLYIKDGTDPRYAAVGAIAKDVLGSGPSAAWGGDWTLAKDGVEPDYDHIQMPNWKALRAVENQTA